MSKLSVEITTDDGFTANPPLYCPHCDGMAHYFGTLGKLVYYMCRYCGVQFSVEK